MIHISPDRPITKSWHSSSSSPLGSKALFWHRDDHPFWESAKQANGACAIQFPPSRDPRPSAVLPIASFLMADPFFSMPLSEDYTENPPNTRSGCVISLIKGKRDWVQSRRMTPRPQDQCLLMRCFAKENLRKGRRRKRQQQFRRQLWAAFK